ncbi:MAG: CRISPR-associated endonuclease Cas2 [Longimicrobiales bacterium]|nr:CRISPR-associated endonuclease Cas2 [Longimicrobiales bacterium]
MTRADRRRYLVTYDISDDKRRDKIFHALHGFGDWAQYSVFFCELTDQELIRMRFTLREILNHAEDQVMILDLGRAHRPLEHSLDVVGRAYEPVVRSFIF